MSSVEPEAIERVKRHLEKRRRTTSSKRAIRPDGHQAPRGRQARRSAPDSAAERPPRRACTDARVAPAVLATLSQQVAHRGAPKRPGALGASAAAATTPPASRPSARACPSDHERVSGREPASCERQSAPVATATARPFSEVAAPLPPPPSETQAAAPRRRSAAAVRTQPSSRACAGAAARRSRVATSAPRPARSPARAGRSSGDAEDRRRVLDGPPWRAHAHAAQRAAYRDWRRSVWGHGAPSAIRPARRGDRGRAAAA